MKKKLFSCILLAVFACVALFGFTACSNGSSYDDSALVDRIEALEDQITQQGETIKNQQNTIDEQDETIKNQAASIVVLQNSMTELQTAKTKLEEQIASLENDNTANKTEITTLKTKVEALEAANANFQQQIDALDTSSGTFAEDLAELTSNYNSLTASVQNATKIERVVLTMNDITSHDLIKDIWIAPSISNSSTVYLSARVEYKVSVFPYNLATCKVILTKDSETSTHYITFAKANNDESGALVSGYSTNVPANSESNMSAKWDELILYRFI